MGTLRDALQYTPVELKFGTSGLRGLVTDMTHLECYINTLGFLLFLKNLDQKQLAGGAVYIAGDLRGSTPSILQSVTKAVRDGGYEPVYCGLIPTPALAAYALAKTAPCVMVTGSHIPDDRNGIKFYRADGEVLKEDESGIFAAVAQIRQQIYGLPVETAPFDVAGKLKNPEVLPEEDFGATELYLHRFTSVFSAQLLKGKKIVFYQHSAVGRDMLVGLFESLGAEVLPVGRSEKFIPIDTENVTPEDRAYFKQLAEEHPDAFAIVSTDGDSDRPFVVDHTGEFHRGDVLGALVADWLQADAAAAPLSVSDAVDEFLKDKMTFTHTRIGSPYVVSAMNEATEQGKRRVVGWEVNGGFMLGSEFELDGKKMAPLPTRDAALPIIVALAAALEAGSVQAAFAKLPFRATQAGMINDFPTETAKAIIGKFSDDTPETRHKIEKYFSDAHGFGAVKKINALDGVRIYFENGDIVHLRPSGNAPQLRCYSVADTQERADEIVELAIAEPDGIFRRIEKELDD